MAQIRLGNFAETAVTWIENAFRKYTLPKGVYAGFDLGVTGAFDLEIGAGAGIQHNGVFWSEGIERLNGDVTFDTSTITVAFTAPGLATDYTVVALHDNLEQPLGVAIEYEIQVGILSDVANGVILGWIRHPGAGAPLDLSMIQQAPIQKSDSFTALVAETQPAEDIPAYTRSVDDPANGATGPDLTITPLAFDVATFTLYQSVVASATAVGVQTVVQHFQYYVPDAGHRPTGFDLWCNITAAPSTQLTVELFDTNQSPVTATGSPFISTTGWENKSISVDLSSGTFDAGKPFTLRLTYQMEASGDIRTGRIRARSWAF